MPGLFDWSSWSSWLAGIDFIPNEDNEVRTKTGKDPKPPYSAEFYDAERAARDPEYFFTQYLKYVREARIPKLPKVEALIQESIRCSNENQYAMRALEAHGIEYQDWVVFNPPKPSSAT